MPHKAHGNATLYAEAFTRVSLCHDVCLCSYTGRKGMVLKAGNVSDVSSMLHRFIKTNSSLGLVH